MPWSPTPFQVSFLLLVSIHSLTFRVFVGKGKLIATWIAAALGFGVAQVIVERFATPGVIMLGSVYVIETTIAAWMAMLVVQRAME